MPIVGTMVCPRCKGSGRETSGYLCLLCQGNTVVPVKRRDEDSR